MQTKISTDRLSLELLTETDHSFILELVNSKGWLEFIGNRNIHSKEEAVAYIRRINGTPNMTYWTVKTKADLTSIGIITFIKRDYLEHSDIGFAFLPEYSGKGFAYEAAQAVLSTLSQIPAYSTILATTMPQNTKSIHLLERLGFRFNREIEVNNGKLHVYANQAPA
ncbi:GNAT family N-acetyltransferase [Sabulibacter ruber]|uniref:GNAT family N-acetyltransferase n=1 Tax=Sabulibacter ruber TaxID=2811901 RepID=UPI001A956F03|nr:GNAT family N-acetyltransferase [Sabulibacter ruber]